MEYLSETVNDKKTGWVTPKTREFINELSFDGYILAGNSVTNMIEGIPLQGDLDFWCKKEYKYMQAVYEMTPFYDEFHVYPSMIEMIKKDNTLPRINLH
jgi:hypothetical protein